jgi:3-oxoacyl-[acyl-carrier-protein] synthase-3
MAKAKIIGTGLYAPGEAITNDEVIKLTGLEFNAEKIESKLGIRQRHIARLRNINESTADFAEKAARAAIEDAGIDPMEIGLFVVGTDTPEYISPCTALITQGRIQQKQTWTGAFDINSSCASFAIALDYVSSKMVADPTLKYAVVTGVYNMPSFFRPDDVFAWSIFADGAGSVVLERVEDSDPSGYVMGQQLADGTQWDYIGIYTGGAHTQPTHEKLDKGEWGLQLLKPLPGSRNVELWPPLIHHLLERSPYSVGDIDHFIFTQINRSVIEEVIAKLGVGMDKTTTIMEEFGYTGSGCIPMALHQSIKNGTIKRGDKLVFIASGSGLAVGSNLLVY